MRPKQFILAELEESGDYTKMRLEVTSDIHNLLHSIFCEFAKLNRLLESIDHADHKEISDKTKDSDFQI